MILLDDRKLEARRVATGAGGPLAPLYDSLAAELEAVLGAPLFIPDAKALLSRAGGRCELDGAVLDFDPFAPHTHRCPVCGTMYTGEAHHRAWITSYQLWLAERAVHAALFHVLRGDKRHATMARDILRGYCDRYLQYPNRDNVLGPTRLFFSTYLESIWLLQICVAADLLSGAGDRATADMVRDRIVEPSRALIAEYDEGMSNRQVWNNAALLAAGALCGDETAIEARLHGASGVTAHLRAGVLRDGTWYEGENYHQFALRGLWYAVTLAEQRGHRLAPELMLRFEHAFVAPFLSALPDFTMPSRKDSQYAVSLRQWRIAELTELGLARRRDPLLESAAARCYEADASLERRDTGRARSTADVERNGPPSALTRADLGWRALLHALPELPESPPLSPRSSLLQGQGLAVFRRDGGVYVGVDYGQSGGGHGHPDRLNLILSHGTTRWLDDLGTGSYVDPSLHWYRSTLAHNAPLLDGRSQPPRDGVLRAYDEREGLGWIVTAVHFPDDGARLERTVVVAPEYLIDEVRWVADRDVRVELPWHLDGICASELAPRALAGGDGLEDGFAFVSDARAGHVPATTSTTVTAERDGRALRALFQSDRDVTIYSARAPGQPASALRLFHVLRATGPQGVFRSVLTWSPHVVAMRLAANEVTIESRDGERHRHHRDASGWHVELFAAGARSSIDLAGWQPVDEHHAEPVPATARPTVLRRSKRVDEWMSAVSTANRDDMLMFELDEAHYRRSEESWRSAGSPTATVGIAADDGHLIVYVQIDAGERRFADAAALNPFDNEHADTMGSGVQLYARTPDGSGAWMIVPDHGGGVRVRPISDWGAMPPPVARWRERGGGYELRIDLPVPDASPTGEYPIDLDLLVNETTSGRERRRGQLVLSGARGEFVYLRGDRHDAARLIPLVLVP